jgi:hypothetical protein
MVRVEIHHAGLTTYERLHAAMAAESFSRTLTSAKTGSKRPMPIGTYWAEFSADPWVVLEAPKRAALPIDSSADIVVSGAGQIVYYPEVPKPKNLLAPLRLPESQPAVEGLFAGLFTTPPPLANPKGGSFGFSFEQELGSFVSGDWFSPKSK